MPVVFGLCLEDEIFVSRGTCFSSLYLQRWTGHLWLYHIMRVHPPLSSQVLSKEQLIKEPELVLIQALFAAFATLAFKSALQSSNLLTLTLGLF